MCASNLVERWSAGYAALRNFRHEGICDVVYAKFANYASTRVVRGSAAGRAFHMMPAPASRKLPGHRTIRDVHARALQTRRISDT